MIVYNDIEEVLTKKHTVDTIFLIAYFSFFLLCDILLIWIFLLSGQIQWKVNSIGSIIGLIFISLPFFLGPIVILIQIFESLPKTIGISLNGVKYNEIDYDWKDFIKIEVVTHKQRSEQSGLVISSTIEYIIQTAKGTFSLKEGGDWGWDYPLIRTVCDKIISHAPNVEIIQREVEKTVSEVSSGK